MPTMHGSYAFGAGEIYIPPRGCFLVVFSRFYPLPPPEIDPVFLKFLGIPEGERDGEGEVRHCKTYVIG